MPSAHCGRIANLPDVFQREFRRRGQAVADVLVPLAEYLQIHGQHQRRAFGGLCAIDEAAVPHHVKLEPEGRARILGDVLDQADAHGREGEGNAEHFRRLGRLDLAVGDLHAGGPRRRERDRHGDRNAEHVGFERPPFQVHRDALTQLDRLKIAVVLTIGGFGPAARIGIVEEHFRHAPTRQTLQILDGQAIVESRHRRW